MANDGPTPLPSWLVLSRENYADAACALYWYATAYHGGQDSTLYSILSTSPYTPGPSERGPSDDDSSGEFYRALVEGQIDPETLRDGIALILDTNP